METAPDMWYCMECRGFLAQDQFKSGPRRTICRKHYNEKWNRIQVDRWKSNPQKKAADITWQVAYRDSVVVFDAKIHMTQGQVLELLQTHQGPIRLLPLDPTKPLSVDNYVFAPLTTRKLMCGIWKKLKCVDDYRKALSELGLEGLTP